MAARTRSLGSLWADIQYRADIPASSDRHPDSNGYRMISESWQALREIVSDNGHQLYLKPAVATLTQGATSPYAFGTISLPDDCIRLYGFDVTVSSNDIRALEPVAFAMRNEYRSVYGVATGIPMGFHIFNMGTELGASVTPGTVGVFPAPDQAYPYTLWYLPSWIDLTNPAYVFNGIAGWEEFIVWDVCLKIAARDNDMAGTAAIATQERAAALERILKGANNIQRVGPATRIDAARMSRMNNRKGTFWRDR